MRRRISHDTYAAVIRTAYLGLMTNFLLLMSSLPLVVLLITTDPSRSWPLLAVAIALAAPGFTAACSVFDEHSLRGGGVIRSFVHGWKATWRRAMLVGALGIGALVVLLVDIRMLADTPLAAVVVPLLLVLAVVVSATLVTSLVAIAEEPPARLAAVFRAAAFLALRRWYLTLASLGIIATQIVVFSSMPAIAIGLTAAPAAYLAWANARYTLRPALIAAAAA